jgi:hypothetical protein
VPGGKYRGVSRQIPALEGQGGRVSDLYEFHPVRHGSHHDRRTPTFRHVSGLAVRALYL